MIGASAWDDLCDQFLPNVLHTTNFPSSNTVAIIFISSFVQMKQRKQMKCPYITHLDLSNKPMPHKCIEPVEYIPYFKSLSHNLAQFALKWRTQWVYLAKLLKSFPSGYQASNSTHHLKTLRHQCSKMHCNEYSSYVTRILLKWTMTPSYSVFQEISNKLSRKTSDSQNDMLQWS